MITSEIGALMTVSWSPNLTTSHDSFVKWSNWSVQVYREIRLRPLQCLTEEEVDSRVHRAAGPACVRSQPLVDVGVKPDRSLLGGWVVVHSHHDIAVMHWHCLVTARVRSAVLPEQHGQSVAAFLRRARVTPGRSGFCTARKQSRSSLRSSLRQPTRPLLDTHRPLATGHDAHQLGTADISNRHQPLRHSGHQCGPGWTAARP